MSTNRELVRIFREMALMLELKEVKWKPRAYREAAYGIEDLSEDVKEIYKKGGRDDLEEISGVGESIADHIIEYIKKGRIKKFEELREKYPKDITELVSLEGLGPKTVKKLLKKLDVSSTEDLKKSAEEHNIRNIKGFGEKTEENILEALKLKKSGKGRMPLNEAASMAEELVDYLKKNAKVEKIDYVGSLRRMKETIGDIDILVISENPEKIMETFTGMKKIKRVISRGSTRSSVILKENNTHVDLRVVKKSSYAAAMQYFTGSKEHNIELRKIAIKKGYKLSEYGLFNKSDGKKIPCTREQTLYKKLGMQYTPPELRENRGEIDAAKDKKLPELVTADDIKGDFHTHTSYSDGSDSVENMVKAARERGYEYIAITDHSKSQRIAKGMDEGKIKKQWKEIDKIAGRHKIRVLKGAEVDILKDGSLDYSESILKKLNIVVAGIHSSLKMPKNKMTDRIVAALNNKYVDIIAHPTGRILGKRRPFDADFSRVFRTAADNKKVLEINSQPERTDLNDANIISARERGARFCIDTDSKSTADLDLIRFGIGQARRGWLGKKDVVNTYSYKELKKIFKRV